MIEGVTRDFCAGELTEIQQQLGAKVEKWCNEPFAKSAVLFIDNPERHRVEVRLFFETHAIFVAQVHDKPVLSDYEVSFSGIEKILYHNWARSGPGVEFHGNKDNKGLLRIHANGTIRVEA